jgi:hypothetical protein
MHVENMQSIFFAVGVQECHLAKLLEICENVKAEPIA